ncbi:ribonuclease H-like domain-containing protein [Tanacetum coccineum]
MDQDSAHMVAASKVPMLKPGEYEIWRMRIEQYIQMIDYALWEVIENDATLPKTKIVEGVMTEMPITTAEEKATRRLEVKARSTLIMGIPNEHQLKFNFIKDAKKLLEALVSQLELLGEKISQEDVNKKLLRSLSLEWNTHTVVWRNKADLDTMSMNDLYNNLRVCKPEVKRMSSSSSSTQNMAFVSSSNNNTSSTNEAVNTAHGVSTASTQVNAAYSTNIDNLSDVVICAFFASQPNRMKLTVNGNKTISFDKSKVECYNCHNRGHFAKECRAPRNQDNKNKESSRKSVPVETSTSTALVSCDGLGGYAYSDQADEGPNYALMAFSSLNLNSEDETSGILKSFITGIENLVDHKVKVIRCDNGTEFKNREMNQFCEMKGILRQFSVARTPQQNGVDFLWPDMNNLDTTIQVSPNPTTRIHKDHPLNQVIGDLQSATQTRKMSKNFEEHRRTQKGELCIRKKAKIGCSRVPLRRGFDSDEVFAPVARTEAIRLFLAYALFKNFVVYQIDVKSDFIYGKIKEEVYVCQPPGFKDLNFPDKVYKVEKALFTEVKTASIPMETQKPLLKDEDGEEVDVHMYRSMIGSLMYLTSLRLDIMFAVCACARYQVNPKVSRLHAVKRIFSVAQFFAAVVNIHFRTGESYGAAVWQIPELYGQSNSPQLECIASLDAHSSKIKCVLWWPSGRHDKLISIDEQSIFLWSLDSSKKSAQVQSQESAGMLHHLSGGAWDPHDVNVVASTSESSIQFWDLRTMKYDPILLYRKINSLEYSHVCSTDYHSKKEHMLITTTDDSGINIWDLRMLKAPAVELPRHSHCMVNWSKLSGSGLADGKTLLLFTFVDTNAIVIRNIIADGTNGEVNNFSFYFLQSKSSAGEASTTAAAPKCCLSNVLVLKEVSHYCLGTRMICAASVYFMLLMQDLMLPVVISYVNAAIDTTAIGFKRRS